MSKNLIKDGDCEALYNINNISLSTYNENKEISNKNIDINNNMNKIDLQNSDYFMENNDNENDNDVDNENGGSIISLDKNFEFITNLTYNIKENKNKFETFFDDNFNLILNNNKFYEKINLVNFDKLKNNQKRVFEILNNVKPNKITEEFLNTIPNTPKNKNEIPSKQFTDLIKHYNKNLSLEVEYKKTRGLGRRFSNKSFSMTKLSRKLRNALYQNMVVDLDMRRSQPTIFRDFVILYELDRTKYRTLLNYNRDQLICDIMECSENNYTQSEAKDLLNGVFNGGGHKDFNSVKILHNEINSFFNDIRKEKIFIKIWRRSIKKYPNCNFKQKTNFLSQVYQETEAHILDLAYLYLKDNFDVISLEFDGFKINIDTDLTDDDNNNLNNHIFNETGLKVQFVKKNMIIDDDIQNLLNNPSNTQNDEYEGFNSEEEWLLSKKIFNNDDNMATYLHKKYTDKIKCIVNKNSTEYYININNIWQYSTNKDCLSHFIDRDLKMFQKFVICENTGKQLVISKTYTANSSGLTNVLNMFKLQVQEKNHEPEFLKLLTTSNRSTIPFLDGVLYINKKGKGTEFNGHFDFKKWKDVKNYYSRKIVKFNYLDVKEASKYKDTILKKILEPAFIIDDNENYMNECKHLLLNLSRTMFACIEDKKWNTVFGKRNSSKGVIVELLKNSYGNFCATTNINSFCSKDTKADTAKSLSWTYNIFDARFLYINEAEQGLTINGALIKNLSGGDALQVRANNVDEKELNFNYNVWAFLNDVPIVEPKDCMHNCYLYNTKIQFVDNILKQQEQDKFGTDDKYFKPPNNDIKSLYCIDKNYGAGFILLLLEHFENSIEMGDFNKENLEDINNDNNGTNLKPIELVTEYAKITGKDTDYVIAKDFYNDIKEYIVSTYQNVKFNDLKIRYILKQHCKIKYQNHYIKKLKKVCKCYVGIRYLKENLNICDTIIKNYIDNSSDNSSDSYSDNSSDSDN